jgi:hypothetical protein
MCSQYLPKIIPEAVFKLIKVIFSGLALGLPVISIPPKNSQAVVAAAL